MNTYTIKEVAEMAKLTPKTVRVMCNDGRIKAVKIGSDWRIPQSEIDILLTNPRQPGQTQALTIIPETTVIPKELTESEKQRVKELDEIRIKLNDDIFYKQIETARAERIEAENRAKEADLKSKELDDMLAEQTESHKKALAEAEVRHKRALHEIDKFNTLDKLIAYNEAKQIELDSETEKTHNWNAGLAIRLTENKNKADKLDHAYQNILKNFLYVLRGCKDWHLTVSEKKLIQRVYEAVKESMDEHIKELLDDI